MEKHGKRSPIGAAQWAAVAALWALALYGMTAKPAPKLETAQLVACR
ncbi:hypothetical protein [Caulobacter hibisci]|uniref:Uncharacterized protein n=1 Tax=Caulobacter hibisci TaxID=2035993 RepID=A0ABS0T3M5_9CAUL|nr:hypothetical protein [Caulobacter hibisci]MBI1686492.1 hypothetical protein [Caulobacter hibisci]